MRTTSKFEALTKYIPELKNDYFGKWVIDEKTDVTPEHPIQMPFVNYSDVVDHFHRDLYSFCESHPEYEHNRYGDVLKQNGLEWNTESMEGAEVSKMDAKTVIALLMGAVRAERFCDGALLEFFEDGAILRWLERLKEIDEGTGPFKTTIGPDAKEK